MTEFNKFLHISYFIGAPSGDGEGEYPLSIEDIASCHLACPVGINVKGYVTAIAEGDFEKALAIIREDNCLPAVCGRICTRPCERECSRSDYGGAINIRALKRFVSDYEKRQGRQPDIVPQLRRKETIAVIGAGPSGLAAANDLAKLGYKVTIFEKEDSPGGLMTRGIPDFRLPQTAVLYDIDRIKKLGVIIETGKAIANSRSFNHLRKKFDAVLLATGAHIAPAKYRIADRTDGVLDHIEFMKTHSDGNRTTAKGSIAITGLGQSTLDTARTALRAGYNRVVLVYPRTKEEFQASSSEIETAIAEGVEILFQTRAIGITESNGKVTALKCVKMVSSSPDKNERRELTVKEGSEFTLDVDAVVPVEPHLPDLSYLPKKSGFEVSRWGYLHADSMDLSTGEDGVFAAGDIVTGPKSVIEAMAAGRRAAVSIHRYLRSGRVETATSRRAYPMTLTPEQPVQKAAIQPSVLPWKKTASAVDETEQVFTENMAVDEARRCLRCGPCMECVKCSSDCSKEIVMMRTGTTGETPFRTLLQKSTTDKLVLSGQGDLNFREVVTVPPDISTVSSAPLHAEATFCVVDPELCTGCGACEEICEYRAPRVEYSNGCFVASIYRDVCRECGTCAAHCPSGAIRQQYFTDEYILDEIENRLKD